MAIVNIIDVHSLVEMDVRLGPGPALAALKFVSEQARIEAAEEVAAVLAREAAFSMKERVVSLFLHPSEK